MFGRRDPNIAAFLEAPRYGVIATHDAKRAIWQAVVWYAQTDDGILVNARSGRRWLTNLRRDARVSLLVVVGEDHVIVAGKRSRRTIPSGACARGWSLPGAIGATRPTAGRRGSACWFMPNGLPCTVSFISAISRRDRPPRRHRRQGARRVVLPAVLNTCWKTTRWPSPPRASIYTTGWDTTGKPGGALIVVGVSSRKATQNAPLRRDRSRPPT